MPKEHATAKAATTRRMYELVARGKDGPLTLHLDQMELKRLGEKGPRRKLWDAALIPETLAQPARLFRGLRREEMEDGLCYVAFPTHRHTEGQNLVPVRAGLVFLVFVTPAGKVFEWGWEHPESEAVDLETFFNSRFNQEIKL